LKLLLAEIHFWSIENAVSYHQGHHQGPVLPSTAYGAHLKDGKHF